MRATTWALLAIGLAAPTAVLAQSGVTTDEIVVTALGRETQLQQTPLSITSVSGAELDKQFSHSLDDLAYLTPSLSFTDQGPSNTRITFRGIQSVGEPTVGVYYGETPVTGLVGASSDAGGSALSLALVDVDRVEALRGPQGTLYGAGALSGAIRVLFRRPDDLLAGKITVEGDTTPGAGPGYKVEGVFNAPLIDDRLAVRLVAYSDQDGGYIAIPKLGLHNADGQATNGARLAIGADPTDTLRIDATLIYQHISGDRPIWDENGPRYVSTDAIHYFNDDTQQLYSLTARWRPKGFELLVTGALDERHVPQANADFTNALSIYTGSSSVCSRIEAGGAACSSGQLSAYNGYVASLMPATLFWDQYETTRSTEIRLSSVGGQSLSWTLGGFASDRTTHIDNLLLHDSAATGYPVNPRQILNERFIYDDLTQVAAFADGSYRILSKLTLSGGIRWFDYHRTASGETPIALDLVGSPTAPFASYSLGQTGTVSRADLSWQARSKLMFYVEASEGFRPGGVNQVLGLPAALTPYRSDQTWNYELGSKSQWWQDRIVANASLFQIDWSNMQVQGSRPDGLFQFISNAGSARVRGAELELSIAPVQGLHVQADGDWLDARLTQDQVNPNVVAPGRKGDPIPYTPDFSLGGAAEYRWPISDRLQASLRAQGHLVGVSHTQFETSNPYDRKIPQTGLVDLRISLDDTGHGRSASLYVANLLDAEAIQYATAAATTGGKTLVTSARPRTLGLQLSQAF
ncbi:MAG: TonB-dependent receptor [Caulobacteraceae bacterium]